jgi:hypothetical protein
MRFFDDVPAPHAACERAARRERCARVHADVVEQPVERQRFEVFARKHRRVVDEHVEPAGDGDRALDDALGVCRNRKVAPHRPCFAAARELLAQADRLGFRAPEVHHDARALVGQRERDRTPDPPGRSGDERDALRPILTATCHDRSACTRRASPCC